MKNRTEYKRYRQGKSFAAMMIAGMGLICMMLLSVMNADAAEYLPYASNNLKYGLIKNSSMATTDTGYVRIMNTADALYIEECDDDFQVITRKEIDKELSIYGGFYSGADAYYFVFGQNNTEEDDTAEVVRVVKYSKSWERLGAAKITGDSAFGHQVRYPFDYGNVNMAEYNGILYIVTGHEGYVDPNYNQGHQGFLMFAVNESTMTGSIKAADLWHSISQHLAINDSGQIYVLEESDGDRMTKVTRYGVSGSSVTKVPVLRYGGTHTSAWAIPTYASADAIALSDSNVLAVGTSIDQTRYDDSDYTKSYNIYLTVTPMNNFSEEATTFKWLTSDDLARGYKDVKLTKISDNRFLLCWEQYVAEESIAAEDDYDSMSSRVLHYEFLDGSGNVIGEEHKVAAAISECEPVIKDGKAVFYSSDGGCVAFYTIDTATGEFNKKLYKLAGENAQWEYADGVLTVTGSGELYANMGSTTFSSIKDKVTRLAVSDGITKINEKSFYNLSKLAEVSLGSDVTDIGASAFGYCAFKEIRVPRGVKTIGDKAFYGNQAIRNVYIPNTVETIGDDILWTGYYWTTNNAKVVYATIYCDKDSAAYTYATEGGIKCVQPSVTIKDKNVSCTGEAAEIGEAVKTVTTGEVTYTYYIDEDCTAETNAANSGAAGAGKAPVYGGTYYVTAKAAADDVFSEVSSAKAKLVISHVIQEVEARAATCTEDGNISCYKCSGCGRYFSDEKGISILDEASVMIPAKGHDYRVSYIWDQDGTGCRGVAVCDNDATHRITEEAVVTSNIRTAVTCEAEGKTEYTATFTDAVFEAQKKTIIIEALGHDYGQWEVTKESTEDEPGEYTRVCRHDASHKETKEIPVLSHTHNLALVEEVAAACTEDGKKAYYACSGCALIFEDEAGTTEILDESVLVIKGGHKGGTATCSTRAVCEVCHEEYGEIDPFNHSGETEIRGAAVATCTKDGYSGDAYCKDCSLFLEEGGIIKKTGHTNAAAVKENVVEPTCTEEGTYDEVVYCSVCGEMVSSTKKTTPALGHDYGEWQVTREATASTYGIETKYCKRDSTHKVMRYYMTYADSDNETGGKTEDGSGDQVGESTSGNGSNSGALSDRSKELGIEEARTPEEVGTEISDDNMDAVYMVTASADGTPSVEYAEYDGGSSAKSVEIPDTIVSNGVEYKVTSVANNAFEYNTKLTKVKIGNNVTEIGSSAFIGCSKLKTVTVGGNVIVIGDNAFNGCKALTKITLPEKTVNIGKQAFKGCKKLKTIVIKSKKLTSKSISKNAFKGVSNKTVIKVPKSKKKAYIKLFRKKGLSKKVKIK